MKWIGLAGAAALVALGAWAYFGEPLTRLSALLGAEESEGQEGGGDRPPPAVAVAQTRRGVAVERFRTSGEVVAQENVMLSAEIAGRVAEIFVEDGAQVEGGDRVLRFAAEPEEAALAAAEAQLAEAEADLRRRRRLAEENVAPEAQVETARARARTARAEVERARATLADQTVRAPFDGRFGFLRVDEGAYLSPGAAIAELASVERLRIRFTLPQAAAEAARDAGEAALEGLPEGCATAEITVASPLTETATRSRTFEAIPPDGCGLTPGAFVTVSVPLERREDAVFAPHEAVVRQGFDAWVYRLEDGEEGLRVRRAMVETGVFKGEEIEIREGVEAGQRIVARGVQKVSDGMTVRPEGGDGEGGAPSGPAQAAAAEGQAG